MTFSLITFGTVELNPASEPHRQFDGDGMVTICPHNTVLREGWPWLPDMTAENLLHRAHIWRAHLVFNSSLPNHCDECREDR